MPQKLFIKIFLVSALFGVCLQTKSQPFKTQKEFKDYLLQNIDNTDFIEGIWEFNSKIEKGWYDKNYDYKKLPPTSFNIEVAPFRVAIIKVSNGNFFCYPIKFVDQLLDKLSDRDKNSCSNYTFESTAIEGQYIYTNILSACKSEQDCKGKAYIKSDGDLFFECKQEEYKDGIRSWNNFTVTATKLVPTQADIKNYKLQSKKEKENIKPKFSYGTGSAISNDLIMTCYHVVKDAKEISIRGIEGRFDTTYLAEINFYDEDLDVAFLKLQRNNHRQNFVLPYSFKQTKSDVGENIFVLGYPLQNTMGQEIKLTTGVISSNSGFLGDTTLFQISAPIQPGNSGGPLFDNNGNLIGLVTAKHTRADNVGYAFKLNLLKDILKRKGVSFATNKSVPIDLSKKVKLYKDYIYSI